LERDGLSVDIDIDRASAREGMDETDERCTGLGEGWHTKDDQADQSNDQHDGEFSELLHVQCSLWVRQRPHQTNTGAWSAGIEAS
jgi:hypothetical protein